ncbi:RNA polymerase-binding protein DksA [Limnohabitans sp.]|uniref:RNA polymerase-binding protein DksA n=1 Tax=Limnohabitans sp. TaxID=1907725 RepID=UPI002FDDB203
MSAKSKKTASKKPVDSKKSAKPVKKSVVVKTPVKPAAKTVAKPVAKKAVPAKVAAKKAAAKPAPAKKTPVKSAPQKAVAKKAVAKKAAVPAKKSVPTKSPAQAVKATAKPAKAAVKVTKAPAKVAKVPAKVAAKVAAKAAKPVAKKAAAKPAVKVSAKAKVAPVPAPVVHVTPIIPGYTPVVHKKNSRAAKMAALVPPPPAQVVASNAAKNSFMPMTAPSAPTIVPVIPKKDAKLANNWKSKTADQMTDAEIIAMPDTEYMNELQMAFFRLKLVHLKNEVLSNASETTEHLREDTVVVPDPADRATIEEEHALELRTRDRERKLLKKIEQSIHRIDSGDYGYCDETGEAIGVGRLLARPTASLSLEAQERREIKQRMFGD